MKTLTTVVVAAVILVSLAAALDPKRSLDATIGNAGIHVQRSNETDHREPRGFDPSRSNGNTGTEPANETNLVVPRDFDPSRSNGNTGTEPANDTNLVVPRDFDPSRYSRQSSRENGDEGICIRVDSDKDFVLPCGANATLPPGESIQIMSMNFPKKYPKNHICKWSIYGTNLEMTCEKIDIQRSPSCKKDVLSLEYLENGEEKVLKECKKSVNFFLKAEDHIHAIFKTDKAGNGNGFSCRITAAPESDTTTALPPPTTEAPESSSMTEAPSSDECRCGIINDAERIVGGHTVTPHKYPWHVAIVGQNSKRPFCGGSIIRKNWILTAAHCVSGLNTDYQALVGMHNWRNSENTVQHFNIKQIIVHENYSERTCNNDIALIELKTSISFSDEIAPICLPPPDNLFENEQAVVSGWGTLSSGGPQPSALQEVTVEIISNKMCKSTGYRDSEITDAMLCAMEDGKDSCQGDSGGPLVRLFSNTSRSTYQVGVVSWGYGCAHPNYPGVYTRVNKFLDWINGHTSGSKPCEPVP